MKKLSLGVILFLAVVTASYLKVTYSAQERRKEIAKDVATQVATEVASIKEQRSVDLALASDAIDSLTLLLKESRDSRDKLISRRDEAEGRVADSLGAIVSKQSSRIKALSQDLKTAQKKIRSLKPKTKKKKSAQSSPDDRAIAKYFRTKVEKLPTDLSDYERRIMIDEIAEKTAKQFSITDDRLGRILKEQKLDF